MITVAILTLSDKGSAGERQDMSGPAIKEMLKRLDANAKKVDLILTTGGTGLSPRDVTPDATLEIIDREVPGIAESMRAEGLKKTDRTMLSRAVSGVRGNALIINLPGSPKAIKEGLEVILDVLPHAIEKIKGSSEDCAR
jgi:molybdopterin biosynthesis enzyme MoaB